MQTAGGKRIYTKKELKQVIQDGIAKNPDAGADGVIAYLLAQDNIYVAEGNNLSDIKPVQQVYADNPNEILSYGNLTTDNEGNLQEIAEDKSLTKDDLTKEERLNLSTNVDKNEYSDIWDKVVKGYDEFKPVKENAELIADTYRELIDKKNELTSMYDSGDSASKEIYKKKLDAINEALANAENSEEFKNVVEEIRRSPLAWYRSAFNPVISSTLFDMAGHRGSETLNSNDSFSNWVFGDVANSPFARGMNVTNLTFSLNELPEIYDKYNFDESKNLKSDDTHSSGGEEEKTSGGETKSETKNNKNNVSINNSPLKPTKITDEKVTDEMSFGDDVAGQGGEEYLKKRNIALATHLKQKGIETPEEIEAYLSKYPSWKNAKQEWKDNTINNLQKNIANIKGPEIKKDETKDETKEEKGVGDTLDVKNKDRLNKEEKLGDKWDIKNKDRLNKKENESTVKNKNNAGNKEALNYKDKFNPAKNWKPDNDTPINGTEEEEKETKKSETKKPETKTSTKKVTKKDVEKVINAAKSSPTIMNLLKKVKK